MKMFTAKKFVIRMLFIIKNHIEKFIKLMANLQVWLIA